MLSRNYLLLPLLLLTAVPLAAQPSMTISPPYAWISQREPFASFTIQNSGTEELEVYVQARPATIRADSGGTNGILSGTGELGDLTPHLSFFPPRVLLHPGERQTVRVLVKNRGMLPPGGYASMLEFVMKRRPSPAEAVTNGVGMALQFTYSLAVPLFFVSGSGEIDLTASVYGVDSTRTLLLIEAHGGFPFVWHVKIFDNDSGALLGERDISIATARYLEIGPLPPTTRQLRLVFDPIYNEKEQPIMATVQFPRQIIVDVPSPLPLLTTTGR